MFIRRMAAILLAFSLTFWLAGSVFADVVPYGEELQNMPTTSYNASFSDLPQSHWAYKYIAEMVNKKVLDGYPDKKFRPENSVSRAEFATIIVKAAGLQAQKVNYSSFSDVKVTDWYSPYIETAKDYLTGFRTAGGSYIFNPTAPATREDITVAIVKLKGYDVNRLSNQSIIQNMFSDYDGISESAKNYVAIAVQNGLVSGYEDGTFKPQNSITRAEAATLLWRAYQYGNDNKDVGGGSAQTTSTQPAPQSNNNMPTPAQQPTTQQTAPSQAAQFSVDTLVGGTGQGDVDGPVSVAKVNQIDSMVLDKDDNIFFLDSSKKKVRKFNQSNGSVNTFRTIDASFNWDYATDGNTLTHYDYSQALPMKLAYNNSNNTVYMQNRYGYSTDVVYAISPSVQTAVYNFKDYGHVQFMSFVDGSRIIMGSSPEWGSTSDSQIYDAQLGANATLLASSQANTGVVFSEYSNNPDYSHSVNAVVTTNDIYILDTGNGTLSGIHLFPRKVEKITTFSNIRFDYVGVYNGKFYASSGATIYEITTDGKLSTFIDGKDLTYNDGNPIKKISQLSFDSKGNVIVYDDDNKAIRRINL
jgi:hypothetical protein